MGRRDPRVDAYIRRAAGFAQPILTRVRETVHRASPDIEEDIKWGTPTFVYKGLVCGVAAFKAHCNLILWKAPLLAGRYVGAPYGIHRNLTRVSDLPSTRELVSYVRKAMALNEAGITAGRSRRARKPLPVPADLAAALTKNRKAQAAFGTFSPSHRREYIQWITDAKRVETRSRRIKTAVAQMAQGQPQNGRYERGARPNR